jgi:hypothetical protein
VSRYRVKVVTYTLKPGLDHVAHTCELVSTFFLELDPRPLFKDPYKICSVTGEHFYFYNEVEPMLRFVISDTHSAKHKDALKHQIDFN